MSTKRDLEQLSEQLSEVTQQLDQVVQRLDEFEIAFLGSEGMRLSSVNPSQRTVSQPNPTDETEQKESHPEAGP